MIIIQKLMRYLQRFSLKKMYLATSNCLSFSIYVLVHSLLGLLILILFSNVLQSSETGHAETLYSLARSYPYEYKMKTQKGVNYYVKSAKFEHKYPVNSPGRVRVEGRVERDYLSVLRQNCRFELHRQKLGFIHETPACDLLQKFEFGSLVA